MFAFSRSSRWLRTKWVRDWCAKIFGLRRHKRPHVRPRYFLPHMEALEDRTLLSVTFSVSGDEISFTGDSSDNIYIEAINGNLSYSTDNATFTPTNFVIDGSTTVNVSTDGTLYLAGLTQSGGTFQATGAVVVSENVLTNGDLFSITGRTITVGNPVLATSGTLSAGSSGQSFTITDDDSGTQSVTLSASSGAAPLVEGQVLTFTGTSGTTPFTLQNNQAYTVHIIDQSDPSKIQVQLYPQSAQPVTISTSSVSGPAGDLTFNANVSGLEATRSIIVSANSQLLAQGVSPSGDGAISLTASRVTNDQTGLSIVSQIEDLFLHNFVATVSIGQNVAIAGGNVAIGASSGDDGLFQNLSTGVNTLATGLLDEITAYLSQFASLPISVLITKATATTEIGQGASVISSGTVSVTSTATANSTAEATYWYQSLFGVAAGSFAFAKATTTAEALVDQNATITANGNVEISSSTTTTTSATALVTQGTGLFPDNANNVQVSGAYNKLTTTSHAIVAQGATITTPASVMVSADATNNDDINVQAASYHDGLVGLTGAGADVNSDVLALVDGTIIAGGGTIRSPQAINPYLTAGSSLFQHQFSGLNRIDLANSRFVFNTDPGYTSGEGIRYSTGGGGAIPGLIDNAIYHVITSQNQAGTEFYVQLATSRANATNGQYISFGQYPTIAGLPITKVDATSNSTIQYDFNPGFIEGQTVTFNPAAGQFLGYDANPGSWNADGFSAGQLISITGASGNNGTYTIASIDATGTVLTLSSLDTLQNAVAQGTTITASGAALTQSPTLTFLAGTSSSGPTITRTGSLLGSLSGNYTVHIVNATPTSSTLYTMQLRDADGHLVQLDDSPYLTVNSGANAGAIIRIQGFQHTSNEVILNPTDLASGLSISNAEGLTYHAGLATHVPGLTDGTAYYAIVDAGEFSSIDPTSPPKILLAASANDAEAAGPAEQAPTFTWTDTTGAAQTTSIHQVQTALPNQLHGDTQSFTILSSDPTSNILTVALDSGSSTNPVVVGAMLTYSGALGSSSTLQDGHIYRIAEIIGQTDSSAIQFTLQDTLRLPTLGTLTEATGGQSFAILMAESNAVLTLQMLGTSTFAPLTEGETLIYTGASGSGFLQNGHSYLVHIVDQSSTGLIQVQLTASYPITQSGALVSGDGTTLSIVSSDPSTGLLILEVPSGTTPAIGDVLTYQGPMIPQAGYLQTGQQYSISSVAATGTNGQFSVQVISASYQVASAGLLVGTGQSFTITGSNSTTGVVTVALQAQSELTQLTEGATLRFQGTSGVGLNTLKNGFEYTVHVIDQSNPSAIALQLQTTGQLAGYGTLQGTGGSYVIHEADADGTLWLSQVGSAQALTDGATVTYTGGSGPGAAYLQNGQAYSVLVVNQDDPTKIQIRLAQYQLPTYGTLAATGQSFSILSFNSTNETVTLATNISGTQLTEGQVLTYTGSAIDKTILLQSGRSYTVHIVDGSNPDAIVVQLLDSTGPLVSDSSTDGNDPLSNSVVLFPPQTLIPNGTMVTYHAGSPGTAIGGLQDGTTYQAVVNAAHPNLVHFIQVGGQAVQLTLDEALTSNGFSYTITCSNGRNHTLTVELPAGAPNLTNGQAVTYSAALGAMTNSLIDGTTYYVSIPDPSDPTHIQLLPAANSTTPLSLQGAIDLGETDLSYMSGSAHQLTPLNSGAGIQVTATLSSTENLSVWSGIGGEAPLRERIKPSQFKAAFKGNDAESTADQNPALTHAFAFTGAFLVERVQNSAVAQIGGNAVLRATGDIAVSSSVTENNQAGVTSTSTIAANGAEASEQFQLGLALAVMVNTLTNTSHALVDTCIRIDAGAALSVTSDLIYPWVGQINNPNGFDAASTFGSNLLNSTATFFDGSLGFEDALVNNWANSAASASENSKDVAIAGSAQWTEYNNDSQARINAGALINQDPQYTAASQSVSVSANTTFETLNFSGNTNFDFLPTDIAQAKKDSGSSGVANLVLAPNQGALAGIGVSFAGMVLNNTTRALVGGENIFNPRTAVNGDDDTIDLGYNPGYVTGQPVLYESHSGTPIVGLTSGQVYYVVVSAADPTLLQLASTADNAQLGTVMSLGLKKVTGADHSLLALSNAVPTFDGIADVSTSSSTIQFASNPGFTTGQVVVYLSGDDSNTSIGGLTNGQAYYAIVNPSNSSQIQLAATYADAIANHPITLTSVGSGASQSLQGLLSLATKINFGDAPSDSSTVFDAGSAIDTDGDTITFSTAPTFYMGQAVTYENGGGSDIGGLKNGDVYYVILDSDSPNVIQLARTFANAMGGTSIDLTSAGSGSSQSLQPTDNYGFNVTANQQVVIANLGTSGGLGADGLGAGGQYGGNGTLAFMKADTNTVAQVAAGSIITSNSGTNGAANVAADDTLILIAVAGSAFSGQNVGIGVSALVNLVTRDTLAIIGDDVDNGPVSGMNSNWNVAGPLTVTATTSGDVINFALSGAVSTDPAAETGEGPNLPTKDDANPSGGVTLPPSFGSWGLQISGDGSYTHATNNTKAYINDSGTLATGGLAVEATDETILAGFGGSYAVASLTTSTDRDDVTNVGIAGSYSEIILDGATAAFVQNAQLTITGDMSVEAERDNYLGTLTFSVAGSSTRKSWEVAGSVSLDFFTGDTLAYVANVVGTVSGAATVTSEDNTIFVALGGGAGVGGTGGIGLSIGYIEIDHTLTAEIENSTLVVGGNVDVTASASTALGSLGLALGVAEGQSDFAGAGNASVNKIELTLDAHISNSSQITSGGSVTVEATDNSYLVSVSGALAVANQGSGAVGAAVSYNLISNSITAYIDDSQVAANGGALCVSATSSPELYALAAGGADANTLAIGGSVTINSVANSVTAYVNSSTVSATADLSLNASENALQIVVAGAIGVSGSTAVGAAIAYNYMGQMFDTANPNVAAHGSTTSSTSAYIDSSTVTVGGDLQISAGYLPPSPFTQPRSITIDNATGFGSTLDIPVTVDSQLVSVAVGGAFADTFSLGAAVTLDYIRQTIDARISNNSVVTVTGDVTITAIDSSSIGNGVLGVGISKGSAAVGASVTSNDIANTLTAEITGSQVTSSTGDVQVASQENAKITAIAVGVAGAEGFALGGSVVVNVINNVITANVSASSTVSAANVTVSSSDSSEINVGSGQVSIATNGPSIGAAVAIDVITNSTISSIDNSALTTTGALDVLANSNLKIVAAAAGGAGANGLALGGSVAINTITNTTRASLSNSPQIDVGSLTASAIDTPSIGTGAGVVSISLTGSAIGASVAVNTISNTVEAYIDASTVTADDHITVNAGWNAPATTTSSNVPSDLPGGEQTQSALSAQVVAVAISGSGGNWNAIAGAAPVNNIHNTISGYIQNSTVSQGSDVTVSATNSASIGTGALGLAIGQDAGGAALGSSDIESDLTAKITGSTVNVDGTVSVTAEQSSLVETVAIGVGLAGSFSLGGSIEVNVIKNGTEAYFDSSTITGAAITAQALDQSTLKTGVGGFAASGGTSVGAALSSNTITNTTEAYLNDSDAHATTGNVEVEATAKPEIIDVAVGGAVSGDVAVDGSITVNVITLTTSAYLSTSSTNSINADGTVAVAALEDLKLSAGAGAITGAGTAAVGIANTTLVTDNTTKAYIGPNLQVTGLGNGTGYTAFTGAKDAAGNLSTTQVSGVSVTSIVFQDVLNVAAGGALAGSAGVAGSVPVEVLNETSIAYIGTGTNINATGSANANQSVHVQAANTTNMVTVAGALGAGGAAGIGAGVDVGTVNKTTNAYIDNGNSSSAASVTAANDILVQANSVEDMTSAAGTIAAGGSAGIGGSVSVYTLNLTTEAYLGDYVTATADGNVQVAADDQNHLVVAAGAISAAGAVAIGASVSVPVIGKTTQAWIGQNAHVVAHGQGAAMDAATGYYGLDYAASTIASSAVNSQTDTINLGFAASTGQPLIYTAASGGSNIGGLMNGATYYAIVPDAANPNQIHLATSKANADAGTSMDLTSPGTSGQSLLPLGISFPSVNQSAVQVAPGTNSLAFLAPDTTEARGVAVTATSSDELTQVVVSGSFSGTVSVPISTGVHVADNTTAAWIGNQSQVNSDQSVLVNAGSAYYRLGVAGSAGVSGAASVGAGVDVAVVTLTTTASINPGAQVTALEDVVVGAHATETFTSVAIGFGGAGAVAVEGAFSVITLNSTTHASIGTDDANDAAVTVSANNNVLVSASDDTFVDAIDGAGAIGIGAAGVGISAPVIVLTKDTLALVGLSSGVTGLAQGSATMDVLVDDVSDAVGQTKTTQGVAVQATSSENVTTWAVAGAAGLYAGFAGAPAIVVIQSSTVASIDKGAAINAINTGAGSNQSVSVAAFNATQITNTVPTVGIGAGGFAGAVSVGLVYNLTQASIGDNAVVHAQDDVDVYALSYKNFNSLTVSIGIGAVGADASVAVFNLGSVLDATSTSVLTASNGSSMSQTVSEASDPISSLTALNGYQADPNSSDTVQTTGSTQTSGNSAAVQQGVAQAQSLIAVPTTGNTAASSLAATVAPTNGTLATIGAGATISAVEDLDVEARENVIATLTAGGGAAGAIAAGASVAILTIDSDLQATIGNGATITVGGNVTVNALLIDNLATAADAAGAGGYSLGAQVAIINDNSTELASIGNDVQIDGANSLTLSAAAQRTLSSNSSDYASIGAAAAGAAVAQATAGGSTKATIGTSTQIGLQDSIGNVTVSAMDTSSVTSTTFSLSAGIGTALVNVNQATIDPTVSATVGDSSQITATGLVAVSAGAAPTAISNSFGVTVGLGVAIAAVVSQATVNPTINSYLDDNTVIQASGLVLNASLASSTSGGVLASASSTAGAGGIGLTAEGVGATASTSGTVSATTGSAVSLPNGNIAVTAQSQTSQLATATAGTAGFLAAGAADAKATSNVTTVALVGPVPVTSSSRQGSLSIIASGSDINVATSVAGSGAAVGVDASDASTENDSTVTSGLNFSSSGESAASQIATSDLIISATRTSKYSPTVNSIDAAVVGGSGSVADHHDTGDVSIDVGDNSNIQASGSVQILTTSSFSETTSGASANAGAGGGVNGVAAKSESTLTGSSAVNVGESVTINSGTNPYSNAGGILIAASSTLSAADQVTLTIGGLIEGSGVTSEITATLTNAVDIGSNGNFSSAGNIGIGTYTNAIATTSSQSNTYGLAAVGDARAFTTFETDQSVTVGEGTLMTAFRNVNLTAGNDPAGINTTTITASADASAYTNGLAGIPTDTAQTTVTSNATLTIDSGVSINSGQNATIGAYPGTPGTAESGTARYAALGVPINTSSSNIPAPTVSATVVQNGTITAGIYHELEITIPLSGAVQINQGLSPAVAYLAPQPDGAEGAFNPYTFVSTYFSPVVAPVLQGGAANTDVSEYLLGAQGLPFGSIQVNSSTSASNQNSIDLAYNHGYTNGQAVVYRAMSGSAIGGLISGTTYYAVVNSSFPTRVQLSATPNGPALVFQSAGGGGQSLEAVEAMPLYAAGGNVSINATSISGGGTITAYGGPSITVTNNSAAYLLLGAIEIPNNPGGSVNFTGTAQLPASQIAENGEGTAPSVTINQTYASDVGGVSYGPALFLTGPISNLGGSVSITNAKGSYGQLGPIRAQQVNIDIANGAAAIDTPISPYNLQDEGAQWNASMLWPGGNPYSSSYDNGNPTAAISYVVNALYNSSGSLSESTLNNHLYWYAGNVGPNNTVPASIVFVGDSFPYVTGYDSGSQQNGAWASAAGNSSGSAYEVNSSDSGAYFPMIPVVSLTQTTSTSATPPSTASAIQTYGGGVAILAKTIDVNGTLSVGEQSNWSVMLTTTLAATLITYQTQYDSGQQTNPIYVIPQDALSTVNSTDNLITASYNAATGQINLDSVTATLHGGYVTLSGAIINTNPLGKIQFNDGLGQVTIDNQTGIPVIVEGIDTGGSSVSQLSITDTNRPTSTQQTVYLYQPGQPIQQYVGAAGAALSALQLTNLSGTTVAYAPEAGLRWNWTNTASLYRTQNVSLTSDLDTKSPTIEDGWISEWNWSTASAPHQGPWTLGSGSLVTSSSQESTAFVSTLSASLPSGSGVPSSIPATVPNQDEQFTNGLNGGNLAAATPYQYLSNSHGYNNFDRTDDHHNYWAYYWPLKANLTQTNSLKADYPFDITFAGGTQGGVNINSNAAIYLTGGIDTGNASTTITSTQGGITAVAGASIAAADLTLNATGAVGSAANPIDITLSSGGNLNAHGGSDGIYLSLNSDADIGQIVSGSAASGYGNIVIVSTGDVMPSDSVQGFGGIGAGWTNNPNTGSIPSINANVLTLTDGNEGEASSVWFDTQVPISNFEVSFVYTAQANGEQTLGNGVAFVLQNQGTSALGGPGGSLGYLNITPSAAYQINIYDGFTEGTNFVTSATAYTFNSTTPVNVASGNPIQIHLTYSSSAQTITETLTDTVTQLTYTHTYTGIDLETLLGGQTAYIGFTGATGSAVATQTISDFYYAFTPLLTNPSIIGNNITLLSSAGHVGSQSTPLVLQATGNVAADGGWVGGIVSASALQDIYLVQTTGNLLVGQITSATGDVSLSAPEGSILQGETLSGLGVSLAEARKVWQSLHLTDPTSSQQTISGFENQIESSYQQYWQLLASGSVQNADSGVGSISGGVQNVVVAVATGTQRVWTTGTSGSFRVAVNHTGVIQLSSQIPWNASAAEVETILNQLLGVQASVTGSGSVNDPWIVSGSGLASIATTDDQLAGGVSLFQPVPFGSQQIWNNGTGGSFTLSIHANGETQTTGSIPYNASAASIQTALNQLAGVNVVVTGQGTAINPWLVSNAILPLLSTDESELAGINVQYVSDGAVQLSNKAAGGIFTISIGVAGQIETTVPLSFKANASDLEDALNQLPGVQVSVTGSGTLTSPWVISGSGFTSLTTDDSQLTGGTSSALTVPRGAQEVWSTATSGSFSLLMDINGTLATTGLLCYNATAAAVQMALNLLPGVRVQVVGNGTKESPWIISGSVGADLSTLTTTSNNLSAGLAGQSYTLDTSALSIFQQQATNALGISNPTPEQIRNYANTLYQQTVTLLDANLPDGWFGQPDFMRFNPNYTYTATPAQIASLTTGAVQTESQLISTIQLEALQAAAGPQAPVVASITALNVTLTAGQAIGQIGTPTIIPLTSLLDGTLTPEQIVLVSQLKNAGEARFVGTNAQGNTVKFSIGEEPVGVTITGIEVTLPRPIFISITDPAGGALTATAQHDISVTQLSGDLHLDQVTSTSGEVRLAAAGSILSHAVSGFGGDGTGWISNGINIEPQISNDVLTLTDGNGSEGGSAWLSSPVATGSFIASFIYTGVANGGDGVAFVLQNDPRGTAAIGDGGGYLGYGGDGVAVSPSVAFEINIWSGHVQGTNFVSNGVTETYFATGDVNVASGNPIRVVLTYDASAKTVTAVLNDLTANTFNTTVYTGYDLSDILGGPTAMLGFTGGDGGAVSTQTISGFSFTSSLVSGPNISAPQINLTAVGSIGSTAGYLQIDQTGSAQESLNATAQTGIYVNAVANDLNVGRVVTSAGDIVLQANDPDLTQSISLGSSSVVAAPLGDVTFLEANGDITFALGSVVTAGTNIVLDPVSGSQFTLSGTLNAQSVQIIGGLGDDTVLLNLAGLNADLHFNGRDGEDHLIVNGTDLATDYVVNGAQLIVNGSRSISTSDVQQMEVHGGAGNDTFAVQSTLAGMTTTLFGGAGGDSFLIGSSDPTVRGTLDHLLGAIQIYGEGSSGSLADAITIDDRAAVDTRGKALASGYILTPTQVIHDSSPGQTLRPTFAGITYDGTTELLSFLGSDGVNNFVVKPSQSTSYVLNGNPNEKHAGKLDTVQLDTTGTSGAKIKWMNSKSGSLSFTSPHRAIQFNGIKQFQTRPLSAKAPHTVIKTSGTSDVEFTVVYRGLTAADMGSLIDNNSAVRVQGPNGNSQLATFVGFVPTSATGKLTVTYRVPAPTGQWAKNDTGNYKVQILSDQIVDTTGHSVPDGVIGHFRVKVRGGQGRMSPARD